jgi:thymidylate synthase
LKEQIEREPYEFPTINILNKRKNINDYVLEDFQIINYKFHPQIKMKMVA